MASSETLLIVTLSILFQTWPPCLAQNERYVGKFREVFSWKQITYNINGYIVSEDRSTSDGLEAGSVIQRSSVFFNEDSPPEKNWNIRPSNGSTIGSTTTGPNAADSTPFFIQYNNVPMGVEKVGERVFIAFPRRRYGIPATLNYIDLTTDGNTRSPALKPYPDFEQSKVLVSVYRTRADECGRLWMVDTGLMEIPNNPQQVQTPAIVIFDLKTDKIITRYELKPSDVPAANTPTGLASITVDITDGDCANAYAYLPDLTTFGIVVYSLKENDSWRLTHNYLSFNPTAGNLDISGQRFQWSDGIFSITLAGTNNCKTAYFHPLISTQEFSVSTCVLKNKTIMSDPQYWSYYSVVGERGLNSQSTMHGYHNGSNVIFFADIGRNAVSCWNTGEVMTPYNVFVLAQESLRMSYPSDLHVTDDEVWVMTNALPRFGYSRYNTEEYNFYVYKGNVEDLISGTVCAGMNAGLSKNINNID